MKVKDVIKQLKKFNQEAELFVSRDEEGNGYATVDKQSFAVYGEQGQSVVIYPYEEDVEVPGMED